MSVTNPGQHDERKIEPYHLDNGYWGAVVVVNGNRSMNNSFMDTDEALDWISKKSKLGTPTTPVVLLSSLSADTT